MVERGEKQKQSDRKGLEPWFRTNGSPVFARRNRGRAYVVFDDDDGPEITILEGQWEVREECGWVRSVSNEVFLEFFH